MHSLQSLYQECGVPFDISIDDPLCLICLDRTLGETFACRLGHGITVWLCERHNAVEFHRHNGGREFAGVLALSWQANGCLTRSRLRALDSHLRAVDALHRPATPRRRPGSYAWANLRREAEEAFADGHDVLETITRLRERHAHDHAQVPSVATMRRWYAECR
jgi:hypothetical protein